jgi:hypothetical protein
MNFFKKKTAEQEIQDDLENAKRKLVEHEHQLNYHKSMVAFYRESIKRLENYTKEGIQ